MSDFYYGPEDLLFTYLNTEKGKTFLENVGSTIDITQEEMPSIYSNMAKNHAIVPLQKLYSLEDNNILETVEKGYLIEHLSTGLHYFVYMEGDTWWTKGIIDFKGTKENPYDIVLAQESYKRWIRSSIDAPGTRIGGSPINSDGTAYSGLWPHLKDGSPLDFLAQYELTNGKYVHIFSLRDLEYDYDYSYMNDDSEDPYSCAIIEDGVIPEWIEMKPLNVIHQRLVHPNDAYILKRNNKEILPAPDWLQGEAIPGKGEFEFLIQIGDTEDLEDEMSFIWGGIGDFYIFADLSKNVVKIVMQCD